MNHRESRSFRIAMAAVRESFAGQARAENDPEAAEFCERLTNDIEARLASSNFGPASPKVWLLRFQVLLQGTFMAEGIPGAWEQMCRLNDELNVAEDVEGISRAVMPAEPSEETKRI